MKAPPSDVLDEPFATVDHLGQEVLFGRDGDVSNQRGPRSTNAIIAANLTVSSKENYLLILVIMYGGFSKRWNV